MRACVVSSTPLFIASRADDGRADALDRGTCSGSFALDSDKLPAGRQVDADVNAHPSIHRTGHQSAMDHRSIGLFLRGHRC